MTDQQRDSVTVKTGLLTQGEFDALSEGDRARVEADTVRLRAKHGDAWLQKEAPRLREEISFAYGV